jgi:hypothetical protein
MRKKINKNILLFLSGFAFVTYGNIYSCYDTISSNGSGEIRQGIATNRWIDDLENKMPYHDTLVELNIIKENVLGTRIVKKDDAIIIKTDSNSLIFPIEKVYSSDMKEVISAIKELEIESEENGAKFLYCVAPNKEMYQRAPENIENYSKENYILFLSEISEANIPVLDFSEELNKHQKEFELFYRTDHHWTVRSGFIATNALLNELNQRYGFMYDVQKTDINNYDITCYQNWFLGSQGKKVGYGFTMMADDFELITPRFYSNLIEEQPFKDQLRYGDFTDTVIYSQNLKKDYYHIDTYVTYSGGDYRLQIVRNLMNPGGKKVLLIRDSFACVVAPFFALQTGELHICDVRKSNAYVGEKLNMKEYIKSVKPDYVLILYNGVGTAGDSRFDFF